MAAIIPGLRDQLQHIVLLTLAFLAFWKGGGPERAVAGVMVGILVSDLIYHLIFGNFSNVVSIDYGHALIDLVAMVALVLIALRANRMYTLWIAALQLIAFNAHLARELTDVMSPIVYLILYVGPSYLQLLILGAGLWAHRRRLAKYGPYKSWTIKADTHRGGQWSDL